MEPPSQPLLLARLASWNIPFDRFDHRAVFTCAESDGLEIKIPGAHTKQLLMRDKRKHHYVLAIVMHDKTVETKRLGEVLGTGRLSFASPPDLLRLLGVTPGSVTPFGLLFDTEHAVRVVMDEDAWAIGKFRFHPLVNTATLVIDCAGFEKFMKGTGHTFAVMCIPKEMTKSQTPMTNQ